MGLLQLSSASVCQLMLLLLHLLCAAAAARGEHHSGIRLPLDGQIGLGWVSKNYSQRLDHFSYTPERDSEFFDQRYFINTLYWNSSGWNGNPPIIVYTGGEWNISVSLGGHDFPMHVASRFEALVVYMEHRYYGDSYPFGSFTEAYKNGSTLGYLDAAQALADFAEITLHVVKSYCPQAACPVIAMGCSYGGMLAAWFRLKYPHLVVGALASSAPVLAPNGNVTSRSGYYDAASQVFENISQPCYSTIKNSWAAIDDFVEENGLPYLEAYFNLCNHLNCTSDLKNFLRLKYLYMAQYYNHLDPQAKRFCDGVTNVTQRSTIDRIRDGLWNYYGREKCVNNTSTSNSPAHLPLSPGNAPGWAWQTCTEMVFPFGSHPPKTMFEPFFYNYSCSKAQCMSDYGITPRPAWISTTFNVSSHLDGFAGNIIFSNGRKDPYSVEGILSDISSTIVALVSEGAHCTDIGCIDPRDPQWLTDQRDEAIKIMEGWILNYHP